MRLACTGCHAGAEKTERAGLPEASKCTPCHQSADTVWPAKRVFRLADFVFFSHARHSAANVECGACHGAVARTDRIRHEGQTTMKFCVSCHRAAKATIDCNACHELSQ